MVAKKVERMDSEVNGEIASTERGDFSGFWRTNRAVLTMAILLSTTIFLLTDTIGVPDHLYSRGYLGGTPYESIWSDALFLIPAALIMPLVGNLQQKVGPKAITILGFGLFGISLIAASLSTEQHVFNIFRILQGLGGGVSLPIAGGHMGGRIGKAYIPLGKSLLVFFFAIGATGGIAISAFITWNIGWRCIYGLFGLLILTFLGIIIKLMPSTPGDTKIKIDWLTYSLLAGGFGLFSMSLVYGNQKEWFQSSTYIIAVWTSVLLIGFFFWRLSKGPPLINPKIFNDINYCVSLINLSVILFFVFMIFGTVPGFMMQVMGNTIGSYSIPFAFFSLGTVTGVYLTTPIINPFYIGRTLLQKKIISSLGILIFATAALWISGTNSLQDNQTLTKQLFMLGFGLGFIIMELQLCFKTMPAELMTGASAVSFFCTNITKAISGGISQALITTSSQGSWDRFRSQIFESNTALEIFQAPFLNINSGITTDTWSQASLEVINEAISKQVDVISIINLSTTAGLILIPLSLLPFLHKEASAKNQS
ncbi:MFS transporter [bacterium]|nr:MFS transporter [bacterium]